MEVMIDSYDVGVIVGRFQVPELHKAHTDLIQTVCDAHDKVILFLGLSSVRVTRENPLDFESRKQMILEKFPQIIVLYAKDHPSDVAWSHKLDEMVSDIITPSQSVVLYGSRDSFIRRYHGKLPTRELVQEVFVSGSETRRAISAKSVKSSFDFRAGVVWAAYSKFPISYATVDNAIFNDDETKLLLGRKPYEELWRFIGGFAEPTSESYEADVRRETIEEAGIQITDPKYVTSLLVDDWRYRGEADKIKTMLFASHLLSGKPTPGDDIAELRWFDWHTIRAEMVVPVHRELLTRLAGAGYGTRRSAEPALTYVESI